MFSKSRIWWQRSVASLRGLLWPLGQVLRHSFSTRQYPNLNEVGCQEWAAEQGSALALSWAVPRQQILPRTSDPVFRRAVMG